MQGKNSLPVQILTVFQEADKYEDSYWVTRLAPRTDGDDPDFDLELPSDTSKIFGYRSTVSVVKRRLSLLGFTYGRCIAEMVSHVQEQRDEDGISGAPINGKNGIEQVVEISCEDSIRLAFRVNSKIDQRTISQISDMTLHERAAFTEAGSLFDYFYEQEPRIPLAIALADASPLTTVRLDLHDLLAAEYFSREEELTSAATQELAESTARSGPIIVLTEGKFDAKILPSALKIVRPDIAGYFKFFDFDAVKVAGGTDRVIHNLKSFAAAGVMNRVIALLDNDAAGKEAELEIKRANLPTRFYACRLPDLQFARRYPTLGPSGGSHHDINGRACSIEFYFGSQCLKGADGSLVPVRWTAFNNKVSDYQGVLADKEAVQRNIENLMDPRKSPDPKSPTWNGIRKVAEVLVAGAHAAASF